MVSWSLGVLFGDSIAWDAVGQVCFLGMYQSKGGTFNIPCTVSAYGMQSYDDNQGIDRRQLIKIFSGTIGSLSLAGCGSNDEETDEFGERVPTLTVEYFANDTGSTEIIEGMMPIFSDDISSLGIDVEFIPIEITTQVNNCFDDRRTHHVAFWTYSNVAQRLDPHIMVRRFAADWAGANGLSNPSNYANCDYTTPAIEQATARSQEERQELINQAIEAGSQDYFFLPVSPALEFQAANTNEVDSQSTGPFGFSVYNPKAFIESGPLSGDTIVSSMLQGTNSTNFLIAVASGTYVPWSQLPYSPLTAYDENYSLYNVLADSVEMTAENTEATITLKSGNFHNGDPITAADVKFSFEHVWQNAETYPQVQPQDYNSITIIDEKTIEFVFPEPTPSFHSLHLPMTPILHRESLTNQGILDNPEEAFDPLIGSGPFELTDFEGGNYMTLDPFDGHPVFSPDHSLIFQIYDDMQASLNALRNDEIHIASQISPGAVSQLEDIPRFEVFVSDSFLPFAMQPQYPTVPMKFREMRKALGKVLNREEARDVGAYGFGTIDLAACQLPPEHPWRPPDDYLTFMTDEPSGDREAAREVLAEAGWEWDNNDNLRFPPDADITPLWPEGDEPADYPDQFPCLQ